MNKKIIRNKKIGILVAALSAILFYALLIMQDKISNTDLFYLYPITLVVGLFFAFLSSTGIVIHAFKQVGTILCVLTIITIFRFLFNN